MDNWTEQNAFRLLAEQPRIRRSATITPTSDPHVVPVGTGSIMNGSSSTPGIHAEGEERTRLPGMDSTTRSKGTPT